MKDLVGKSLAALIIGLLVSPAASAQDARYMAGFYIAIKGIQVTALSGTADMWAALGHSQKAQETLQLAKDLEKGDLGPEVAQKALKVSSVEVQDAIEQLEAVGAPLTKEQNAAAQKAYLKIFGTGVLWAGAAFAAIKTIQSDELNIVTKALLLAAMTSEANEARKATGQLLSAWKAYREFNAGVRPMRGPSKELMEEAPLLAAL
jgi:hypothetical protein